MELDDDARLEMVVKLPQSFPLRAAEAEIRRKAISLLSGSLPQLTCRTGSAVRLREQL